MASSIQKRVVLFVFGCIATRLALVWAVARAPASWLPYLGALALIPAVGFATIYIGGLRKTGAEVFGDRIWWNDLRPVHAALYATFALMAMKGMRGPAWKILLLDVCIGAVAFLAHHLS